MRTALLGVGVGFICGIAVAVLYFRLIAPAQDAMRSELLLADVYQPVEHVLLDVVGDYDHGDAKLAEQKVRLLQQGWQGFLRGGATPEQFQNTIVQLKPSSRPAE